MPRASASSEGFSLAQSSRGGSGHGGRGVGAARAASAPRQRMRTPLAAPFGSPPRASRSRPSAPSSSPAPAGPRSVPSAPPTPASPSRTPRPRLRAGWGGGESGPERGNVAAAGPALRPSPPPPGHPLALALPPRALPQLPSLSPGRKRQAQANPAAAARPSRRPLQPRGAGPLRPYAPDWRPPCSAPAVLRVHTGAPHH